MSREYDIKRRVYGILEIEDSKDFLTVAINLFLMTLLVVNVALFFLETFEGFYSRYLPLFWLFEILSVVVFTIEYLLRLWTSTIDPKFNGPVKGRLKYALTSVFAITDLIAILPFYLALVIPIFAKVDLLFLKSFRLFRVLRLFKLARYSESFDIIERVINRQKSYLVLTFAIQVVLLLVSSGMMYYAEHGAQPEKFANIFDSLWWGLIPLTTVGYGDIYPVTAPGKIIGSVLTFLGIIVMALPIGVITTGLEDELRNEGKRVRRKAIESALVWKKSR